MHTLNGWVQTLRRAYLVIFFCTYARSMKCQDFNNCDIDFLSYHFDAFGVTCHWSPEPFRTFRKGLKIQCMSLLALKSQAELYYWSSIFIFESWTWFQILKFVHINIPSFLVWIRIYARILLIYSMSDEWLYLAIMSYWFWRNSCKSLSFLLIDFENRIPSSSQWITVLGGNTTSVIICFQILTLLVNARNPYSNDDRYLLHIDPRRKFLIDDFDAWVYGIWEPIYSTQWLLTTWKRKEPLIRNHPMPILYG